MDRHKIFGTIRIVLGSLSILFLILAGVLFVMAAVSKNATEMENEPELPSEVSHRVLFLCSYNPLYFTYEAQVTGLAESLYPAGVEYDVFYLDSKNYRTDLDFTTFYIFLRSRLNSGSRHYDAVLVGDDDALNFTVKYQKELFDGLPIVYFGINDLALAEEAAKNPLMTGFFEKDYLYETMELVDRLFPDTEKLVAMHDESAAGMADMKIFQKFAGEHPAYSYDEINTSRLSIDELTDALEAIPENSVLLYMTSYTDENKNTYSLQTMTNLVVNHTSVPIFRNYIGGEGEGIFGGVAMDMEEQGRLAGETIVSILNGKDVNEIPFVFETPGRISVDWGLLMRYNIDPGILPGETIIYNRPATFMEQYGKVFFPAVLIGLSLCMIIANIYIGLKISRINNAALNRSRDELQYLAEHDEFLDIMNRRTATEYLRRELNPQEKFSIVLADLDDFQGINESYGHLMADEILKALAVSLQREADVNNWTVARYGGDEFLFLIPGRHLTEHDVDAEKICKLFKKPIQFGEEEVVLSAGIGISNSDGETASDGLIGFAEIAMYEAKKLGHGRVFVYSDVMRAKAIEENRIKEKLQNAFENDGFFMLYQPQINSQTKKVSGYEALVRMKEPGVYPGQFIPVAEANGWIWKIGRITTELVIKQLAAWRDEGYELHPVSVNYSSSQMNDMGYMSFVEELLKKYDIPPQYLEIEITEGLFLEHTKRADQLFARFKEMGIRLLMDDFGTGYSSLGYLTYIPVDVIKLDKSLVDTYLVDGKDAFIRDVIQLVHDLNKEMIIEGVEEGWQFERLREFKADTIQGYYFSKPIPPGEAIGFTVEK